VLRIGLSRTIAAVVVLSLGTPAYTSDKFPDYPVHPAGDYAVKAEKDGVIVGVEPVENIKEQKTYFDTDLAAKGFVPVFIVVQNQSSENSFLFEKSNVGYTGISKNSTPDAGSKVGVSMAAVGMGGLIAMKLITNATHIQQNLLKKEVQSKTLSPGTSVHGFLYIRVPKEGPRQKIHLQVPITKSDTSQTFVLNLLF